MNAPSGNSAGNAPLEGSGFAVENQLKPETAANKEQQAGQASVPAPSGTTTNTVTNTVNHYPAPPEQVASAGPTTPVTGSATDPLVQAFQAWNHGPGGARDPFAGDNTSPPLTQAAPFDMINLYGEDATPQTQSPDAQDRNASQVSPLDNPPVDLGGTAQDVAQQADAQRAAEVGGLAGAVQVDAQTAPSDMNTPLGQAAGAAGTVTGSVLNAAFNVSSGTVGMVGTVVGSIINAAANAVTIGEAGSLLHGALGLDPNSPINTDLLPALNAMFDAMRTPAGLIVAGVNAGWKFITGTPEVKLLMDVLGQPVSSGEIVNGYTDAVARKMLSEAKAQGQAPGSPVMLAQYGKFALDVVGDARQSIAMNPNADPMDRTVAGLSLLAEYAAYAALPMSPKGFFGDAVAAQRAAQALKIQESLLASKLMSRAAVAAQAGDYNAASKAIRAAIYQAGIEEASKAKGLEFTQGTKTPLTEALAQRSGAVADTLKTPLADRLAATTPMKSPLMDSLMARAAAASAAGDQMGAAKAIRASAYQASLEAATRARQTLAEQSGLGGAARKLNPLEGRFDFGPITMNDATGSGRTAGGYFDPATGTIHVDRAAIQAGLVGNRTLVSAVAHEMTHAGQWLIQARQDPEKWAAIDDIEKLPSQVQEAVLRIMGVPRRVLADPAFAREWASKGLKGQITDALASFVRSEASGAHPGEALPMTSLQRYTTESQRVKYARAMSEGQTNADRFGHESLGSYANAPRVVLGGDATSAQHAAEIHAMTTAQDGATYSLKEGDLFGKDAWAVGAYPERTVVIPSGRDVIPADIKQFIDDNKALLDRGDVHVGTWKVDEPTEGYKVGDTVLDLVKTPSADFFSTRGKVGSGIGLPERTTAERTVKGKTIPGRLLPAETQSDVANRMLNNSRAAAQAQAVQIAKETGQRSIFNLRTGKTVQTPRQPVNPLDVASITEGVKAGLKSELGPKLAQQAQDWYPNASEFAHAMTGSEHGATGVPFRNVGVAIAALSPQNNWIDPLSRQDNMKAIYKMVTALNNGATEAPFDIGGLNASGDQVQKAWRALTSTGDPMDELVAPKERSFALNILGERDMATVDRYIGKDAPSVMKDAGLSPAEHDRVQGAYQVATDNMKADGTLPAGWHVRDTQALQWGLISKNDLEFTSAETHFPGSGADTYPVDIKSGLSRETESPYPPSKADITVQRAFAPRDVLGQSWEGPAKSSAAKATAEERGLSGGLTSLGGLDIRAFQAELKGADWNKDTKYNFHTLSLALQNNAPGSAALASVPDHVIDVIINGFTKDPLTRQVGLKPEQIANITAHAARDVKAGTPVIEATQKAVANELLTEAMTRDPALVAHDNAERAVPTDEVNRQLAERGPVNRPLGQRKDFPVNDPNVIDTTARPTPPAVDAGKDYGALATASHRADQAAGQARQLEELGGVQKGSERLTGDALAAHNAETSARADELFGHSAPVDISPNAPLRNAIRKAGASVSADAWVGDAKNTPLVQGVVDAASDLPNDVKGEVTAAAVNQMAQEAADGSDIGEGARAYGRYLQAHPEDELPPLGSVFKTLFRTYVINNLLNVGIIATKSFTDITTLVAKQADILIQPALTIGREGAPGVSDLPQEFATFWGSFIGAKSDFMIGWRGQKMGMTDAQMQIPNALSRIRGSANPFGAVGEAGAGAKWAAHAVDVLSLWQMTPRLISGITNVFARPYHDLALFQQGLEIAKTTGGLEGGAARRFATQFVADRGESVLLGTGSHPDYDAKAWEAAQGAVFTNKPGNDLMKALDTLRNSDNPIVSTAFFTLFPFMNTMSNIAARGMEYVPGLNLPGLLPGKMGKLSDVEQASRLGHAMIGAIGSYVLAGAAIEGNLTGDGPSEQNARIAKINSGFVPNSIRINGVWIENRNFGPLGFLFNAIGNYHDALTYDVSQKNKGTIAAHAEAIFRGTTHTFLDSSHYVTMLGDAIDIASNSTDRQVEQFFINYASEIAPYIGNAGLVEGVQEDRTPDVPSTLNDDKQAELIAARKLPPGLRSALGVPTMNVHAGVKRPYAGLSRLIGVKGAPPPPPPPPPDDPNSPTPSW
jgi:hypothetical protein